MTFLYHDIKFAIIIPILVSVYSAHIASADIFRPPEGHDDDREEDTRGIPWHPNWDKVVRCKPGESHSRFPECTCGQYASVLEEDSVFYTPLEELAETEGVHWKRKGNRKIHYICLPCSSCPDGVRMTGYCRQGQDTSCDPNHSCIDSTHVFDHRIKACVPPDSDKLLLPQIEPPAVKVTVNGDLLGIDGHGRGLSTLSAQTKDVAAKDQTSTISSGIMLALVIVIALLGLEGFVIIVILLHKRCTRRRHRTLKRVPSELSQVTTGSQPVRCFNCIETLV